MILAKHAAPLLILAVWPWLTGMGAAPNPGVGGTLADYQQALITYFRPFGLIPIPVPSGQRPGDAYAVPDGVLLARAERCFPGLEPPAPETLALPTVVTAPAAGVENVLGLPSVLRYEAGGSNSRTVHISFSDAETVTVGWKALQSHWSENCPELGPIFSEARAASPGRDRMPVVLGTVLYAKPKFSLEISESARSNLDAEALTRALQQAKNRLPFLVAPEVTVGGERSDSRTLTIEAERAVPVAFAPAAFPFSESTGPRQAAVEGVAPALLWRPYDPLHDAAATTMIDRVVDFFTLGWLSSN